MSFKVQLVLFPRHTLMQGEHSPVGFTPATAMNGDAQASLSVTGTAQHWLVETPTSLTDLSDWVRISPGTTQSKHNLAVPSNFPRKQK